ncbi:MAG TPA: helix-turn-helix domain-containing protein [Thermoanaerobaculia bacterium]|jgi:transcriptional regulator with XRE-family HTH domain|nr:helix-turn-helix domain-containing protein [Thermoanaerobaculia bacterium]
MSDRFEEETLRLGQVLKALAKSREKSIRSLEQKMEVADGIFYKVLNGKITMQMRHLLMIVEALGMRPAEFFEAAYPKTIRPVPKAPREDDDEEEDLEGKVRRILLHIIRGEPASDPEPSSHPSTKVILG